MGKYTGCAILGTLAFYLLSVLFPFLLPMPTLLAWLVPLFLFRTLGKGARRQSLLLLLTGVVGLLFSASQGVFLGWKQIFATNLPILAMFVATSFLSLTSPNTENPALPKGKSAVLTTALGTHLLGGVINMSVLFVFGDRLQKAGVLSRVQLIILARSFSSAAWWSPFFIAAGVALIYAPGMYWKKILIPGGIMSVIAISYSIVEVCYFQRSKFCGYPLKIESMLVPAFLFLSVLFVHHFRPNVSILILICLFAPLGAVIFMKGRPRIATLHDFIDRRVLLVGSQFALFLAAGMFSTSLKSIIHVYPVLFSLETTTFTPLLFAIVLGTMIIVGILGIHPIVSISIVSPLLLPIHPNPSQLGFLFLSTWAISTPCSPLSGVGLALISRYQASPQGIIQSNWHYAILMWAIASIINVLFFTQMS